MDPDLHSPSRKRPRPFAAVDLARVSASYARVPAIPEGTDHLVESLLALSNPSADLDLSLERVISRIARGVGKDRAIEGAVRVGSALIEAAKKSARRRATRHNSSSWPLPPDLTIRVFSMLDTWSLCQASVTCSMFNNCALDPLCYANIDLTATVPKVNNAVVSMMIQRAGKNLRSLKLGICPSSSYTAELVRPVSSIIPASSYSLNGKRSGQGRESSFLTRSCLLALNVDGGVAGGALRRLHLYSIDKMNTSALCLALSACCSLLDLEVIGPHIELKGTLDSLSTHCRFIERLFFELSETGRDDSLKSSTCDALVIGCPRLMSLALRGFKLNDDEVCILVKGFRNLKLVDLSTSSITGAFLRTLCDGGTHASALEVLILHDCLYLKEVEVARFISAVIAGGCKLLRHLDISNKYGLAGGDEWYNRCYSSSSIPISRGFQERPDICFLAEFPQDESFVEIERSSGSEFSSNTSLQMLPIPEFCSDFTSSSDSSCSSNDDCFE